jgi:hypothetical protein
MAGAASGISACGAGALVPIISVVAGQDNRI